MQEIKNAIKQICDEKNLSYDIVVQTIESALAAAYRKDFGKKNQNIKIKLNEDDITKSEVFDIKTVVENFSEEELELINNSEDEQIIKNAEGDMERKFNPKTEIQLKDAILIDKKIKIGDELIMELEVPSDYGRMAAQTAKQVIIQRLREAERENIYADFKNKEHEVISGVIQRVENGLVFIDLGKTIGILPQEEQIFNERYTPNARIKVYVKEVSLRNKGPEIIVSRISEEILKKIFYLEIPEISNNLIELKAVAREAGSRSKVAVWSDNENVDPIGSCVGQRGARIQIIINELGGEKVDIIEYDDNIVKFIENALSPAKINHIEINENEKKAVVAVATDQLSLAIGKGGQNARLAARLTGWKIDIIESIASKDETEVKKEVIEDERGEVDN